MRGGEGRGITVVFFKGGLASLLQGFGKLLYCVRYYRTYFQGYIIYIYLLRWKGTSLKGFPYYLAIVLR